MFSSINMYDDLIGLLGVYMKDYYIPYIAAREKEKLECKSVLFKTIIDTKYNIHKLTFDQWLGMRWVEMKLANGILIPEAGKVEVEINGKTINYSYEKKHII